MIPTSAILIVSGIAFLSLSAFIAFHLSPREDKPVSFWARTEARATAAALGLLMLFITGGGLLARGIFA